MTRICCSFSLNDFYIFFVLASIDKAFASRRQWYFFSRKMQNRTAENGFWKEIGVDETILTSTGNKVGIKKYLVFYDDDVRSENKTNWIMEEYRLLISPKGQNQIQVRELYSLKKYYLSQIQNTANWIRKL